MNGNINSVPEQRKKRGKLLPALCNLFGTLILVVAIASCIPVVVPRLMGYEIYNVVSPSMEPEIPVGSILYVKSAEPTDIEVNEVIAFHSGNSVITHRVVENHVVEGEFTTKGDANAGEDMNAVPYGAVIGRVVKHYPMLGALMDLYTSTIGKLYVIIFAACGAILNLIAGRLRDKRNSQE